MALVKCAKCGKDIARNARTCPGCGHTRTHPMVMGCAILIGLAVLAALIGAMVGCGGGSDPVEPAPTFSGVWGATITVVGGTSLPYGTVGTSTLSLAQNGAGVSGTVSGGVPTTIAGTVSGDVFTFTITQAAPCPGTFTGTGSANAARTVMDGSYSGADCTGTLDANFTATKR